LSNIVECDRCRKTLIEEELSSHICTPHIQGAKEILIDYSFTITDRNGDKVTIAKGLDDGISYRLVECKHAPTHRVNPRLKPRNPTTFDTKKNPTKSGQNRSGTTPIYRI